MLGSSRASLHKHSHPLPKQFKHVDVAAQEAGKVGKTKSLLTPKYTARQIPNNFLHQVMCCIVNSVNIMSI